MSKWQVIIFCLSLMISTASALEKESHPFTSITQAKRFQLLTHEIRCVVCQGQSIADSNAPLANDLREKIYHMMLEKKSDKNIKAYLVKRYGEFILLKPQLNQFTLILWLFPCIALLASAWILHRIRKK